MMPTEAFLDEVLLPGTRVKEGMFANTYPLIKNQNELEEARQTLKDNLRKELWRELQ